MPRDISVKCPTRCEPGHFGTVFLSCRTYAALRSGRAERVARAETRKRLVEEDPAKLCANWGARLLAAYAWTWAWFAADSMLEEGERSAPLRPLSFHAAL